MRAKKRVQLINKYFTYTNRERNGILVLILFLAFLQISIFILHFLPDPDPLVMDSETKKMITLLNGKLKNENAINKKNYPLRTFASAENKKKEIIHPEIKENFNPNGLSIDAWMEKGLTEKQAASIIHWQEKGGTFRSVADVQKMFVISPANFKRMEPFIRIPEQKNTFSTAKNSTTATVVSPKKNKSNNIIDINLADSSQLLNLPLIGEGRARSIIKYRTMLGGFINLEQLQEVRNLPDSVIELIKPRLTVNAAAIKKLNINTDSLYHPYLPKAAARLAVQYRKMHGDYHEINDLLQLPLFNEEILRKLAPYLTVKQ